MPDPVSTPPLPDATPASQPPRTAGVVPPLTAWQVVADNFSTRLLGVSGVVAYVVLAYLHAIPGTWAGALIAATVLPPELTRQLVKPAVARLSGTGLAVVLGVAAVHKVLTYGAIGTAAVAALAGALS